MWESCFVSESVIRELRSAIIFGNPMASFPSKPSSGDSDQLKPFSPSTQVLSTIFTSRPSLFYAYGPARKSWVRGRRVYCHLHGQHQLSRVFNTSTLRPYLLIQHKNDLHVYHIAESTTFLTRGKIDALHRQAPSQRFRAYDLSRS